LEISTIGSLLIHLAAELGSDEWKKNNRRRMASANLYDGNVLSNGSDTFVKTVQSKWGADSKALIRQAGVD
jgi:hypothetical protein